jgi:hypothetical protein
MVERADVLAFQTEPLDKDVAATGPLDVRLLVSKSAMDTDFVAKLVDVHSPIADHTDGYALLLSEGILRLRYRDDRPAGELVEPGAVYEIVLELRPAANAFKRGHRIRLDVTSSCFPEFDVNPNTSEPLERQTHVVVAHQTMHHDALRSSRVMLPMVRSGAAKTSREPSVSLQTTTEWCPSCRQRRRRSLWFALHRPDHPRPRIRLPDFRMVLRPRRPFCFPDLLGLRTGCRANYPAATGSVAETFVIPFEGFEVVEWGLDLVVHVSPAYL